MNSEKRFITKKDEGGQWKVYDKANEAFMTSTFDHRSQAVDLAKIYEDHYQELKTRQASGD